MRLPSGDPGRFELRRLLGEGGSGIVYLAWDTQWKTDIALKRLREVTPDRVMRMKREFRLMVNIRDPNVVQLYELHESGDGCFITMEYVKGPNILQYVRGEDGESFAAPSSQTETVATQDERGQRGSAVLRAGSSGSRPAGLESAPAAAAVDPGRLREAFSQLASGMVALHQAGLVHRDIKNMNVKVDGDRVVLLDFDLIRSVAPGDSHYQSRQYLAGTLDYMSPEQMCNEPLTPATDWYSLESCCTKQSPAPYPSSATSWSRPC